MKIFATEEKLVQVCRSIQCDRCKRVDDEIMQMQEYFCFSQDVGYAGVLGDGNRVRLDLCQRCFRDLFKGIYRIEGNYISGDGWYPPEGFLDESKESDSTSTEG